MSRPSRDDGSRDVTLDEAAGWRVVDRTSHAPPPLFCPRCDRCIFTSDDVRSRDSRGVCSACGDDGARVDRPADVVRIVLVEEA